MSFFLWFDGNEDGVLDNCEETTFEEPTFEVTAFEDFSPDNNWDPLFGADTQDLFNEIPVGDFYQDQGQNLSHNQDDISDAESEMNDGDYFDESDSSQNSLKGLAACNWKCLQSYCDPGVMTEGHISGSTYKLGANSSVGLD